jgi:hypothetical protein
MRPEFDEKDAEILASSQLAFDKHEGPRVGDFVQFPGEDGLRRITHDWGDSLQTTVGPKHSCDGDSSFYFEGGFVSFSGSLDPAIGLDSFVDTGKTVDGSVWFFHHNWRAAHNGVYCKAKFRVYKADFKDYRVTMKVKTVHTKNTFRTEILYYKCRHLENALQRAKLWAGRMGYQYGSVLAEDLVQIGERE